MQAEELGETVEAPAQNVEFVLSHSDNVEAQGFVQHLKLPHYIDFQAELNLVRKLRQQQVTIQNSKFKIEESDIKPSPELIPENCEMAENVEISKFDLEEAK
nr:carbon-phosphorus lyase complex subunit PhnI [Nostoc sp. NOS(2021)]